MRKLIVIIWLGVIFYLTASPSATGANTQYYLEKILGIEAPLANTLNAIIRRLAHIIVFGLLAVFLYFVFSKNKLFWSWFCTTLYAATDEFHQTFVSGRTPAFYDIALDSFAAIIALMIVRKHQILLNYISERLWG
ncbi:VanZ family protein [Rummeliibacillus sp. JY-2-4R]